MRLIEKTTRYEIWEVDGEFYVYGYTHSGDPKVCPSIGMARAYAAEC